MFYGREEEIRCLDDLWGKGDSSLVVCSGRRRIGKSTLIEEFARKSRCRFIEIEGLAPDDGVTNDMQLKNFCERLARQTGMPEALADGWPKAFDALHAALRGRGRTVVLLDEISWMGAFDKAFPAYLKNAWDQQFSRRPNLVFVICGSVSSWIADNILNSRAFVGRISLDLKVDELPLSVCRLFWGRAADRVSTREMFDLLSVTGGVPKYLAEMRPSLSAAENIRRLCFSDKGYLYGDFDRIFTDIFRRSADERGSILRALARHPLSLKSLAGELGVSANGHLSGAVKELVEAGFVSADEGLNPVDGREVREVAYRIRDNYVRFYLKYIEPKKVAIRNGSYAFASLEDLSGWDGMMGLQFENLVRGNVRALLPLIGFGNSVVTSIAPYFKAGSSKGDGFQIDLLVQTKSSVCVVEIKRQTRILASVENDVREKVRRLALPRSRSVRTALVYEGRLAPEIAENAYFDFLVPAERLLRP